MGGPVRRWAEVVETRTAARETRWLLLDCPDIAEASRPGQFVMVGFGVTDVGAPLLPRPFSVGWRSPDGRVGLLVREFGEGTRRIGRLSPGERVLLLGPLGNGFRLAGKRPTVCVAGGVGLAPFLFLLAEAQEADVRLVYGERTGERVFDSALVRELTGVDPEVWTEDGSRGARGTVVDGLELAGEPALLACGPAPMLGALARVARQRRLDLQVSVEEHMGCGVGTCQGCVVRAADGRWIKACTDGPVFDAAELRWRS
jgi:dihydroorotate dehydrogenase electron transfer subunit